MTIETREAVERAPSRQETNRDEGRTASLESPNLWKVLLPPAVAFVLVRLVVAAAAASVGFIPWLSELFARWDSGHYVGIALEGYRFGECAVGEHLGPGHLCGNAGWMPAYPILIALISKIGISAQLGAAILSSLFAYLILALLWSEFLGAEPTPKNNLILLIAAFFPGHIYYHAIFPISMFVFFALAAIAFQKRSRHGWAGVSAGVATLTYTTGILIAPVLVVRWVMELLRGRKVWGFLDSSAKRVVIVRTLRGLALSLIPVLVALASWLIYLQAKFGAWNATIRVQSVYGHGIHNPIDTLFFWLKPAFGGWMRSAAPAWQTILIIGFVAVTARIAWARRNEGDLYDVVLYSLVAIYFLFPLVIGKGASIYRAQSLLLPGVILLRHAKLPLVAGALAACVILSPIMAVLFFHHALV